MTPSRKRRLIAVVLILTGVTAATAVALIALNDNLLYFQSPSDVHARDIPAGQKFRLGGMVKPGSVSRDAETLLARFAVTDYQRAIQVEHTGILPDLFKEGQGVIAHGRLTDEGVFVADRVLAKHDENYTAPEISDALERAGNSARPDAETLVEGDD